MVDFNPNELQALSELVNPDQDDDQHIYGSALGAATPATMAGRDQKEIAKPNVQMHVKTYNRAAGGGAPESDIRAAEESKQAAEKLTNPKNQIWSPEEVQE